MTDKKLQLPSGNLAQETPNELTLAYREESWGEYHLDFHLYVMLPRELNENDRRVIGTKMRELIRELNAETARLDPVNQAWKDDWLGRARAMFTTAGLASIYLKEIDNEYCGPQCCPHRVWLLVTTRVGTFKVGWRKRVIEIDWSETCIPVTGMDLFASEDVTKGDKMVHAWGYEKAAEYIRKIVEAA